MKELQDYSSQYKPDFQFSDLSKDALVRLIENYQRIFVGICGMVYTVIREKLGNEEALRLWREIYGRQVQQFEVPLVREAMNIQGDDVVTMMKYFQTCPDGARQGMYVYDCDIKNKNHAILTFTYCRSLFYFERHEDAQGIQTMCGPGGFEELAFESICKAFNPDMKCRALKLPPRKSKDDTCCVWEFKVEPWVWGEEGYHAAIGHACTYTEGGRKKWLKKSKKNKAGEHKELTGEVLESNSINAKGEGDG